MCKICSYNSQDKDITTKQNTYDREKENMK